MSDELAMIQVRLDALHSSLLEVKGAMRRVQRHRDELRELWDAVYSAENSIWAASEEVKGPLARATPALEREFRVRTSRGEDTSSLKTIVEQLRESEAAVATLQACIDRAENLTTEIRNRAVPLSEEPLGRFSAGESISQIKSLREKLAEIAAGNQPEDGRSSGEVVAEAWEAYGKVLDAEAGRLFTEYVDLLGGLALRDAGLDEGICQMADELIRRCSMVGGRDPIWYSMTVPARREAMEETLARIIRLGFPEWTIWAVPLGAVEFGHVVVKQNAVDLGVPEATNGEPDPDSVARAHFLADTFATYALGPAYACAAILLRFNPLHGYEVRDRRPPDAKRAYVVFETLERMNEVGGYYTDLITRLRKPWDAVLARLNPGATPVEEDPVADDAVETMWNFLKSGADESLYYGGDRWLAINGWPDHLIKPSGSETIPWNAGQHEVRDLLTAAWDARSRYPTATATIATEAMNLWGRVRMQARPRAPETIRTTT